MPHLSELHGAATHLAVVAIPLYVIVLLCRRADLGGDALVAGRAVGRRRRRRGHRARRRDRPARLGAGADRAPRQLVPHRHRAFLARDRRHADRLRRRRPGGSGASSRTATPTGTRCSPAGCSRWSAVLAQGYLGGRMTYHHGVGVDAGGQFAQTAHGVSNLEVALAKGTAPAAAGRQAFARSGLGCASCHGDQAQGLRGPGLAGGAELEEFRHVHGTGLFPPAVVTDRDFAAINAWLRTLAAPRPS